MANFYALWNKARKSQLMLPITALIVMLIVNAIITPGFFKISINNGVLYGFLIDILNRSSELIILAVGMTFVAASSRGTDISVGTIAAVSAALIVRLLGSSYDGYAMAPALAIFFGLRNQNKDDKTKNKVIVVSAIMIDAFEIFKIIICCQR